MRVFVRIEKLDVGPDALGVEIVRSRAERPVRRRTAEEAVHPLVVFLDNADDRRAPTCRRGSTRLQARGLPLILAVGLPDLPRPVTGHRPTQRRIDLLAIEQNAWTLAARDPRCVVVATRTEIDWAMQARADRWSGRRRSWCWMRSTGRRAAIR